LSNIIIECVAEASGLFLTNGLTQAITTLSLKTSDTVGDFTSKLGTINTNDPAALNTTQMEYLNSDKLTDASNKLCIKFFVNTLFSVWYRIHYATSGIYAHRIRGKVSRLSFTIQENTDN